MTTLRTDYKKRKIEREDAVYAYFQKLSANEASDRVAIIENVMKKFGIYSRSTVYAIVHRVEKRMKQEAGK
jgi:hypothetical protein